MTNFIALGKARCGAIESSLNKSTAMVQKEGTLQNGFMVTGYAVKWVKWQKVVWSQLGTHYNNIVLIYGQSLKWSILGR